MISRRCDASVMIEPGRTLGLLGGGCLQLVTVLLSDPEPNRDQLEVVYEPPVAATVTPEQARGLAFCLLELAEHAERVSRR